MQTTANNGLAQTDRITIAAHSTHPVLSNQLGQIVFEDRWLTNWSRANTTGSGAPSDFAAGITGDGNLLRVRTISNLLDIAYATPGDTFSWTTLGAGAYSGGVPTAVTGGGVAIFISGANVDVYFQSDATHIVRIQSSNNGNSFGAQTAITTLAAQTSASFIRMASPASGVLFFTSSPTNVVAGAATTSLSSISYAIVGTGVTEWDLYLQPLGVNSPVLLPDGTSYISTLAAYQVGTNDYLLSFYAAGIRGDAEYGLYTMRVKNVAAGLTAQWCNPQKLISAAPQKNASPSILFAFPKLQAVGNEYWLTALEASGYANNPLFHLCCFRTLNFVDWSDREYLAGTDLDWTHLVSGSPSNWTLNNILFGQIVVATTRTFVMSYDNTYVCTSTTRTYPASTSKQWDATVAALSDSLDSPMNGDAAAYSVTLKNDVAGNLDAQIGSTIIEGGEIILSAGYSTTSNATGEQIQVARLVVDDVPEDFTRNKATRSMTITARDYTRKLIDYRSDAWYEYTSGRKLIETSLQDASAFKALNGNYVSYGTGIASDMIDPNYATYLDNSLILPVQMKDGELLVLLSSVGDNGGWPTSATAGIIFNVIDSNNYFTIVYSNYYGKFQLYQARPATSGITKYNYGTGSIADGTVVALQNNRNYYFHLKKTHNRIVLKYNDTSVDNLITWNLGLDYTFPNTGTIDITKASYWGLISKGAVTPNDLIGNTRTDGNFVPIVKPGYLNRMDVASKFPTPPYGGFLRSIRFMATRVNASVDLTVGVIKMQANGQPADIVGDPTNIVWSTTVSPTQFGGLFGTPKWFTVSVPTSVPLIGSTSYYVWLAPVGNSTTMGYWDIAGANDANAWNTYATQASDDSGATWFTNTRDGWARTVFACQVAVDQRSSGVAFYAIVFAEDAVPQTFDSIVGNIAAKAGVLSQNFTPILSDSFTNALDSGTDGTVHNWCSNYNGAWATSSGVLTGAGNNVTRTYMRQNSYWGTIGDFVLKSKMKIITTGTFAGFTVRGGGSPSGGTFTGYEISIGVATGIDGMDQIYFNKIVNSAATERYGSACVIKINPGQWMDIKIVSSAGWYQMFINDMLAASFFHQGITVPDYVGFFCYGTGIGNVIANWDDFSISDLGVLRDSYVFPPDKDARSAIQELIGNERIDIRMRYDGALVATRDRLRASVDTYSTTVEKIRKIFSNVDGFSQAQQADQVVRWVGKLLERGRHVKFFTFPDAQNDVQSYEQMREPIRAGQEKATQWNVDCAPVFTAECGDRVTLANQDSGETVDVVIKSMNWRRDFQTKLAQGSVLFHKFIS